MTLAHQSPRPLAGHQLGQLLDRDAEGEGQGWDAGAGGHRASRHPPVQRCPGNPKASSASIHRKVVGIKPLSEDDRKPGVRVLYLVNHAPLGTLIGEPVNMNSSLYG